MSHFTNYTLNELTTHFLRTSLHKLRLRQKNYINKIVNNKPSGNCPPDKLDDVMQYLKREYAYITSDIVEIQAELALRRLLELRVDRLPNYITPDGRHPESVGDGDNRPEIKPDTESDETYVLTENDIAHIYAQIYTLRRILNTDCSELLEHNYETLTNLLSNFRKWLNDIVKEKESQND